MSEEEVKNDEINEEEKEINLAFSEPILSNAEEDDEESESISFGQKYNTKIDREDVFVNESGDIVDSANLTPFDKLKISAKRLGQTLDEPDPSCKHCFGRGYTGINIDGNIPIPCKCIYKTFYKNNPNWQNQEMPQYNRKAKRHYEKAMNKYIMTQVSKRSKELENIEKSKANLGKNTPNFVPGRSKMLANAFEDINKEESGDNE